MKHDYTGVHQHILPDLPECVDWMCALFTCEHFVGSVWHVEALWPHAWVLAIATTRQAAIDMFVVGLKAWWMDPARPVLGRDPRDEVSDPASDRIIAEALDTMRAGKHEVHAVLLPLLRREA